MADSVGLNRLSPCDANGVTRADGERPVIGRSMTIRKSITH
jgi:hypothetical protein